MDTAPKDLLCWPPGARSLLPSRTLSVNSFTSSLIKTSCILSIWQVLRRDCKKQELLGQPPRLDPGRGQGDYNLECWPFLQRCWSHKACLLNLDKTLALRGLSSLSGSPYLFLNCNVRGWITLMLEICIPYKYLRALYTECVRACTLSIEKLLSINSIYGPVLGTPLIGGCFFV